MRSSELGLITIYAKVHFDIVLQATRMDIIILKVVSLLI